MVHEPYKLLVRPHFLGVFRLGDFEGRRESLSPPGSVQVRGLSGSDTLSKANLNEEIDLLYIIRSRS